MKRILLLLTLWLPLPACEDDCGNQKVPQYFDVQGMECRISRTSTAGEPGGQLSSGGRVSRSRLRLSIDLQARYYSRLQHRAGASRALACTPHEYGYRGTTERVDSLVIYSRYDYDATHPAGSSLNELLNTTDSPTLVQITSSRIADVLGQPARHLQLVLKQAPTASARQQFVVRYRQTNGEVYSAITEEFIITP